MFQRLLRVSAAFAALTTGSLTAGPILYTLAWNGDSSTSSILESFNASSPGSPTTIGDTGFPTDFGALAYDTANDTLYMVDGYGNDSTTTYSSLYSVNLSTGAATLIGSTGLADVTGLTYDSANNTLYAVQAGDDEPLEILNITTGAATAVGSGIPVDRLAYDSTNGVLYGFSGSALYAISTAGGSTLLTSSGLTSNNSGIVYDPVTNLLYNLDVEGHLTTINPTTYAQSAATDFGGGESSGLALIPATSTVPEPSAFLLLGFGMAMMIARRRAG